MNIVEDSRQSNIYLYADDAKIYKSIATDDDANYGMVQYLVNKTYSM